MSAELIGRRGKLSEQHITTFFFLHSSVTYSLAIQVQ